MELTEQERLRRHRRDEKTRKARIAAMRDADPPAFKRYRERQNRRSADWKKAHSEWAAPSKKNKARRQELAKVRRANNVERHRAYQRDFYRRKLRDDVRYNLRLKFDAAKARAKKKGVPFDLTPEDITIPETCPILGIPLIWRTRTGKGERDHAPALDRIKNSEGYVKGNVQVISTRANRWKNDMTLEDAKRIVAYMELHELLA